MFSCVGGERLLRHKGQQELAIFLIAHDGVWPFRVSFGLSPPLQKVPRAMVTLAVAALLIDRINAARC